ncbi:MAG: hypothetical protein EOO50_04370 [Flavobacterium sp.]|uniref:hypothetical protein n=1 Tax=Flavobacterium sp. TaxID=239 RepID=UPI00120EE510|nr:hypothetical protein [Flavobacterium sp.]RZJ67817.1 MAG: hypothetical protein EOO50_04370 [Flavobacterium sp.]
MKKLLLLFLFTSAPLLAQVTMEFTPDGFQSFEIPKPNVPVDKLESRIRGWVMAYNERNEFGYDVYDVSENGLKIDAYKMNAFYYRNRGETFQHRIKYTLKIDYLERTLRVKFSVAEVYMGKNRVDLDPLKFFNSEGKLKADYLDAKPSLEKTAQKIVDSFVAFMSQTTLD